MFHRFFAVKAKALMKKLMQSSDKSTYLRAGRPVWVVGFVPALVPGTWLAKFVKFSNVAGDNCRK
ncbi:MAG: hypothetical protein DRH03_11315 [Deltaproteobacteria bacterium]|nr:MAG: hypothetical protein DRH03_11315 [Deltaproteobacteria bacterium]